MSYYCRERRKLKLKDVNTPTITTGMAHLSLDCTTIESGIRRGRKGKERGDSGTRETVVDPREGGRSSLGKGEWQADGVSAGVSRNSEKAAS